jgi:hypothetical protein
MGRERCRGPAQMPPHGKARDLGHAHDAEPAQQPELRHDVLKQGDQHASQDKIEGDERRLLLYEVEQQTVPGRALTDHAKSAKGWL